MASVWLRLTLKLDIFAASAPRVVHDNTTRLLAMCILVRLRHGDSV